MNFKYLVIEGPIGAGKTTLATRLAESFQAQLLLDRPWENPFLPEFYQGTPGAAFKSQLYFLADRLALLRAITRNFPNNVSVVSDFLLEKDKVFAYLNLNDSELVIYNKLFEAFSDLLIKPDLVIYLKADVDTLFGRIERRKIRMEDRITPAYMHNVVEAYDHFFFQYQQKTRTPLLVLESSQIDFTAGGSKMEDLFNFIRWKNVAGLQYYAPATRG